MKKIKLFIWITLFLMIGISGFIISQNIIHPQNVKQSAISLRPFQHLPKQFESVAVIGGVGDILIHDTVYKDALTKKGNYNFDPMFAPVYPLLQKPDFLIANQESVPGGARIGLSGYPNFNSPYEIIDAIMNAGVNMVTTANNHMLDKGETGLLSAIDYYEKKDMPYTGTFKSQEDKNNIRIQNVNGIKLAILAYSYGTNGIQVPQGKDYLVSILDTEKVMADIKTAKDKADVILLALHWGEEYAREPNQRQIELAHQFIEAGADIIFGHHPHVLQPIEWIDKPNGDKGLVVYSLGNFISGQKTKNPYINIGGMIEVSLKKSKKNQGSHTTIEDVNFLPTYCANTQHTDYRVFPLNQAQEKGFTNQTEKRINQFMFSK